MKKIVFYCMLCIFPISLWSQGCSDAGVCSIGDHTINSDTNTNISKFRVKYVQSFASGEKKVFISTSTLNLEHRIGNTTSISFKIPFIYSNGNLGSASGIGDVTVTLQQSIPKSNFSLIAGARLKSNDANLTDDNKALPMTYQTSLGTNDLLLGATWFHNKWMISTGYQHSFDHNQNMYSGNDTTLSSEQIYQNSVMLKRGDDAFIKLKRSFDLGKSGTISPFILPVYRLQEDQIFSGGKHEKVANSEGLTLNLGFEFSRPVTEKSDLHISAGFPLITRDVRPDGLTRSFVLNIGLGF